MSTPPSSGDLTGVWQCDDGGLYYVRQGRDGSVTWAGLQDSGFHKGMEFGETGGCAPASQGPS